MVCAIRATKTKALISFAVTAKLICVFGFAYANSCFSNAAAQMGKIAAACQPVALALFIGRKRYIRHTIHHHIHKDICPSHSYLFPVALIRFVGQNLRKLAVMFPKSLNS